MSSIKCVHSSKGEKGPRFLNKHLLNWSALHKASAYI